MALKIICKASATTKELEHALNESKILSKLTHPNIIKLIDFFDLELAIILVLPLMDCSLDKYLELQTTKISEKEAL